MSEEATLDEFVNNKTEKEATADVGNLQQLEESPISEWTLNKLGSLLTLEYGDNLPSNSREEGDIPVFGSNGQVDTHSESAVDEAGIIMGRKGSIGEIKFSEKPFWPIDTTYYLTKNETDENLRFLYYLLQNIQLERLNAASAIPGLNRNDAYGLNALVPKVSEQRKLATVLYTVDQVIEKTEDIIESLQTAREGLTQELLVSGFEESADLVSTRVGPISFEIPSHWNVMTIDDIAATIYRYPTYQNIDYVNNGVPEVRIGMLDGDGSIERGEEKHISESTSEEYPRTQLEHGDTIMAVRGATLGKTAFVPEWLDGGNINPNLLRISSNDEVLDRYLTELFLSSLVQKQVEAFSQQTTVKTIKSGDIRRIAVPIPPITEQEKIIDTLSSFSSRIQHEDSYLSNLQRLKRGLMQDLLSGTVRTTDTIIEVPDEVTQYG